MSDWMRVNRTDRCPICNKDTWCTYNDEVVLCMRIQSDRELKLKDGSVGWIHRISGGTTANQVNLTHQIKPKPTIDASKIMDEFDRETRMIDLRKLADSIGVSCGALKSIGCAWARKHNAYAFPMRDGANSIVGVRLRSLSGQKWAVSGSKQGIFIPQQPIDGRIYICEGPTDTAAALTIGVTGIGRPHCSGGLYELICLIQSRRVREVVIIADNDDPGINGAKTLADHISIPSCIMIMPCKDMREFVKLGGAKSDLETLVSQLVWRRP